MGLEQSFKGLISIFRLHRNIPLLFIIRLCKAATINLIWTTWPLFVKSLGASVYETSLVWALGAVVSIVLLIPCSVFVDRFGRKTAMLLSVAFIIVPNFAYTLATSWEVLIPLKMLASVADMLYSPAEMAMITDISVSKERGRAFSIVQFAHPIGSIPSPIIGGWILDNYGWNAVFYGIVVAAALSIVPSLLLTETKAETARVGATSTGTSKGSSRFDVSFLYVLAIFFLFNSFRGIEMSLHQVTPFYLSDRFNVDSFQQGLFFSVGTMVPQLVFMLPAGWLADRYSRRKIALVCSAAWPLLVGFWPQMNSYTALLLLRMFLTSWNSISQPAVQAYLMDFTDPSRRGLASGVFMLGHNVGGSVVGTTLMGFIYEEYGSAAPFYVSASLGLPCIPLIMLLKKREGRPEKDEGNSQA